MKELLVDAEACLGDPTVLQRSASSRAMQQALVNNIADDPTFDDNADSSSLMHQVIEQTFERLLEHDRQTTDLAISGDSETLSALQGARRTLGARCASELAVCGQAPGAPVCWDTVVRRLCGLRKGRVCLRRVMLILDPSSDHFCRMFLACLGLPTPQLTLLLTAPFPGLGDRTTAGQASVGDHKATAKSWMELRAALTARCRLAAPEGEGAVAMRVELAALAPPPLPALCATRDGLALLRWLESQGVVFCQDSLIEILGERISAVAATAPLDEDGVADRAELWETLIAIAVKASVDRLSRMKALVTEALVADAATVDALAVAADLAKTAAAVAGEQTEAKVKAVGDKIRALKEKLRGDGLTGKQINAHPEVEPLVAQLVELKEQL